MLCQARHLRLCASNAHNIPLHLPQLFRSSGGVGSFVQLVRCDAYRSGALRLLARQTDHVTMSGLLEVLQTRSYV